MNLKNFFLTVAIIFCLNAFSQTENDSIGNWLQRSQNLKLDVFELTGEESFFISKVEVLGDSIRLYPKYNSDLEIINRLKKTKKERLFIEGENKTLIIVGNIKDCDSYIEIVGSQRWFH